MNKWHWGVDQWLEDKVWAKVHKEHGSPHFFFLLGFMTSTVIMVILSYLIIKVL